MVKKTEPVESAVVSQKLASQSWAQLTGQAVIPSIHSALLCHHVCALVQLSVHGLVA